MHRWVHNKEKGSKEVSVIYIFSLGKTTYLMFLCKTVLEAVPTVPMEFNRSRYKKIYCWIPTVSTVKKLDAKHNSHISVGDILNAKLMNIYWE